MSPATDPRAERLAAAERALREADHALAEAYLTRAPWHDAVRAYERARAEHDAAAREASR